MSSQPLVIGWILSRIQQLRFPRLFALTAALFLLDLIVPDVIPFSDEILLGLATAVLGTWSKHRADRRGRSADRGPG